ncbi:MAG: hypothetical protein AAGA28_08950 [Pseudomonadota bacterium]
MSRLKEAVTAGIITEEQRRAIEALGGDRTGLRLSMVHVLWLAGTSLIVFAMILLAADISRGNMWRLMWVCLVYAAGLFAIDQVVRRRTDLHILSSLLLLGIGASAAVATCAFIELHLGLREVGYDWYSQREQGSALLNGIYLPGLPVLVTCAILVWRRGFLPGWIGILGVLGVYVCDVFFGAGFDTHVAGHWVFLLMSFVCFGLGWYFDLQPGANHGFWINKMGLLAFFIFTLVLGVEWPRDDYLLLLPTGLFVMLFSIYVRRPAGVSGGAVAVAVYIGYWVFQWDNLYVATAVIALFGIAAIYAGVRAHLIEDKLDQFLPNSLRALRPRARQDPITFGY